MRSKIKPVLGVVLAMLAVSMVASGSASATTCKAESNRLCIEGKQIGSPTERTETPFSFKQKAGVNPVLTLNQELAITCETVKTSGLAVIESGGGPAHFSPGSLGWHLAGCKTKLEGRGGEPCRVSGEEMYSHRLTGTFGLPREVLTFAPSEGSELFMQVEVINGKEGGCPAGYAQTFFVYGSLGCTLKQAGEETATKILVCEPAKSKLELRHGQGTGAKFGTLEGTIELTEAHKGQKFSIST